MNLARLGYAVVARALAAAGWCLAIAGATIIVSAWSVAFPGPGLG